MLCMTGSFLSHFNRHLRLSSSFRCVPLPKQVLHWVESSYSSFNLQHVIVSLKSSCSYLRLLPLLPVPSVLPSIVPSITCFRSQCPHKMWPIQLAFPFFIVCVISLIPLLYVIVPHRSHDRSKWATSSFSSTTFQMFPSIFGVLSELSNFQHGT
jgi:hypothetical protein